MTVVNTNIEALRAMQSLVQQNNSLTSAIKALSTGQRINSAADDAAGLSIADKLNTQIRGLNQAVRNANDGISMLQTTSGAAQGMTNVLYRMKELAVQGANGTYSSADLQSINKEFSELKSELNSFIQETRWNGKQVIGSAFSVTFQIGNTASDKISAAFFDLSKVSGMSTVLGLSGVSNSSALSGIDSAISKLASTQATYGATVNRLVYAADNSTHVAMHTSESRSRIMDTDYAQATSELARAQILQYSATAMLTQANQRPAYVLALLR